MRYCGATAAAGWPELVGIIVALVVFGAIWLTAHVRRKPPRTSWLAGASSAQNGLCVPGVPERHTASVILAADGVLLRAPIGSARLSWRDARPGLPDRTDPGLDGWCVTIAAEGQYRRTGVGIGVAGRSADAVKALHAELRTRRNRFLLWPFDRRGVPLWASTYASMTRDERERTTFAALCAALAARPGLRAALDHPGRVERLAVDLGRRPMGIVGSPTTLKRSSTEILGAMVALGYDHWLWGRPVPGDALDPPDVLRTRIADRIAANPHARDVGIDLDAIEEFAAEHYYAVEPWPFGALVDTA